MPGSGCGSPRRSSRPTASRSGWRTTAGRGARFCFTLPVALQPATGALTVARVLAVDDDTALLRVLRIGLVALGHEVLTAATGAQGISQAAVGAPDVIVLDLGLPDIDGLEVCRRIRQWSAVPIIVLSADGTEDRKIAALDGGADDYMTKPFGMGELEARLRVALAPPAGRGRDDETDDAVGRTPRPRPRPSRGPHGRPGPRPHHPGVRLPGLPGPPRRQGLSPTA